MRVCSANPKVLALRAGNVLIEQERVAVGISDHEVRRPRGRLVRLGSHRESTLLQRALQFPHVLKIVQGLLLGTAVRSLTARLTEKFPSFMGTSLCEVRPPDIASGGRRIRSAPHYPTERVVFLEILKSGRDDWIRSASARGIVRATARPAIASAKAGPATP